MSETSQPDTIVVSVEFPRQVINAPTYSNITGVTAATGDIVIDFGYADSWAFEDARRAAKEGGRGIISPIVTSRIAISLESAVQLHNQLGTVLQTLRAAAGSGLKPGSAE